MAEQPIQTRRQRAYSRREREQIQLFYRGLGLVGVLVLIVLLIGVIQTYVIEPASAIAVVDGREITVQAYRDRVRYERFLLDQQLAQIQEQLAAVQEQDNQQFAQFYTQLGNQILQQRSVVDQQTLDQMITDELVEAEAEGRDITVTDAEIDAEIDRVVAQQVGGLTQASASETVEARIDATSTAAIWTPTPTLTPSPTITPVEAITLTETLTPTATPANTPLPAPTPTLNVIADNALVAQYQTWLAQLNENASIGQAQYRQYIRAGLLREKMREVIGDDAPRLAEQSRARHILISTEVQPQLDDDGNPIERSPEELAELQTVVREDAKALADELVTRLEMGEDFAELAQLYSDDPGSAAQGGDLGFVTQGTFVDPVDEAVFSLPIGEISEPVESQFGWHVIEVLEREERELSAGDYEQRRNQTYQEWLDTIRAAATIEDYWTPEMAPRDSFFTGN